MQLVRQSWVNRPLHEFEVQQLQAISHLGGYLAAGLPLLVHEFQASAHQLLHLHPHLPAPGAPLPRPPKLAPDLATAWEAESLRLHRSGYVSSARLRMELSAAEEMRVLCSTTPAVSLQKWKYRQQYEPIRIPPLRAVDQLMVHMTEQDLLRLVLRQPTEQQVVRQQQVVPAYPLSLTYGQTAPPLVEAMHAELQQSWHDHHKALAAGEPFVDPVVARKTLMAKQVRVKQWRSVAQDYLQTHIKTVPDTTSCHGAAFKLHQLSGTAPLPSLLDMVRWAEKPELIERFNPFLSKASCSRLHAAVLLWLQLAVLEDRLQRAVALLEAGPEYMQLLVQELETYRSWDVHDHPSWLMFEAEGQLQIRPKQYTVAQHLISNPGAIVQLNMGEGKTRVILPMLALHWADGKHVVRLNLLSKLLDEAHSHLHRHLCASVLNRKLFTLPFHRDVRLTGSVARAIWATLLYCKQEGGMLLVAPEHRLSLQLKWHELWPQGGEETMLVMGVLNTVSSAPYIDVLDESDELLHHRFQLIYAMGTTQPLPSREQRVAALQALMRALSQLVTPDTLPRGVAVFESTGNPGCFSGIRLLQGSALQETWPQLCEGLADALIARPPYELSWIEHKPGMQDHIKQCVLDDTRSAEDILGSVSSLLTTDEYHHVLALRGFLACGLLLHCLQQRKGVDFGINRSPSALKRLAVPYRAAHSPSERSEFAQPDVAMTLTHISYYCDGLTRAQLLEAITTLLKMGPNAQEEVYKEWLQLSQASMTAEHLRLLDRASKIDTSSSIQLDLLHQYYSHNQAVVDFWLAQCVLPVETQQYPQRLSSSSWDVAHNMHGKVVGFSGTNDNHRLLPLQVHKSNTDDLSLSGTNGKMLDTLLNKFNSQYHSLVPDEHTPLWQQVLDLALHHGLHAIIDCGALLAGTQNREAAHYLLGRLAGSDKYQGLQGVTYFDTKDKHWTVLDLLGRSMPLDSSPIRPGSTFTIYDDARCRGADLQLRHSAVGLVTLSPTITKDKLMQAAGRLRQIGKGQSVQFVGTQDVSDKIRSYTGQQGVTSRQVLEWVVGNTVQANMHGLCAWSHQGLHYAAAQGVPERAFDDEVLELEPLYGSSTSQQPVAQVVQAQWNRQQDRCSKTGGLSEDAKQLMATVVQQARQHGAGFNVVVSRAVNEECERELERQEEEEEETERELPRVTAAAEQDWQYDAVLGVRSLLQVPDVPLVPLKQAAALLQPNTIIALRWSPAVYCTQNHLLATAEGQQALVKGSGSLNEFLRPVDAMLLMPTGQLLLLSEREADRLQQLMWQQQQQPTSRNKAWPILLHLPYLREAVSCNGDELVPLAARPNGKAVTAADVRRVLLLARPKNQQYASLVSAMLLNGDCMYGQTLQNTLEQLVHKHREEAQALVACRGKMPAWSRSDLEHAASE